PGLDRPNFPGAPSAALDLVIDQDDAVLIAQASEEREEFLWGDDHPPLSLDRFGEDRRDAARDLGLVDEPLQFLDPGLCDVRGSPPSRIAIRVGAVGEEDLPDEGAEPLPIRLFLPREADVEQP